MLGNNKKGALMNCIIRDVTAFTSKNGEKFFINYLAHTIYLRVIMSSVYVVIEIKTEISPSARAKQHRNERGCKVAQGPI